MHQTDPETGELSFELLAEIAVGQTARVELCRVVEGPLNGDLVAVKRLHPHIADDPQFVDMFRDEVWMTAALKHPHVVEVVGWGQDGVGPWLAVEFVRGVSLQRLMKTVFETGERFTERMVVYLARCICDGLVEAHNLRTGTGEHLNLVHRDLTPGNILLGFDGQVKITDFGLAKAKQRLTKTLTGLLKGQPQYMSPEQVQGRPLDGRSDVFALGVVLFELFGGRRPWKATSDLDAMRAITDEPPGDLFALRPRIDKALVEVVDRCLQKDPAARWPSAVDLRARLDEWLNAHGYRSENHVSLARFVRRNAMRQMRWFERAMAGEFADDARVKQAQPLGRISALPNPPSPAPVAASAPPKAAPPPARSSASTHRAETAPGEHTRREQRASSARETREQPAVRRKRNAPPPRAEAPTRVTDEPDENIDWGDDGPTLVQRSQEARSAIKDARKSAKSRQRIPSSGEPTTRRRRIDGVKSRRKRGDTVTQVAQNDTLGVVAPPDPDVPPPPTRQSARPGGSVPPQARGPHSPAPGRSGRPVPSAPPMRSSPPPVADEPSTQPDAPQDVKDAVDATGMTRPISREEIEAPKLPERPSTAPFPNESLEPASSIDGVTPDGTSRVGLSALGAMPAPRFPSMPSLSQELPSMDVGSEARRFGEAAQRAADFADAAARAAHLAGEAAILAADGQRPEAIARLREAQRIEEALNRGEVPSRNQEMAVVPPIPQGGGRGWLRRLQSPEGVAALVVVCIGLVFVVLVLAVTL